MHVVSEMLHPELKRLKVKHFTKSQTAHLKVVLRSNINKLQAPNTNKKWHMRCSLYCIFASFYLKIAVFFGINLVKNLAQIDFMSAKCSKNLCFRVFQKEGSEHADSEGVI